MRCSVWLVAVITTGCRAPAPPPAHADTCDLLAACARGCGEHRDQACDALIYPERHGLDLAAATAALRAGCDDGEAFACVDLADSLAEETRVISERAVSLLQPRCDQKDGPACNLLGALYVDGKRVNMDLARAHALFQAGCDAGFARACTNLGNSAGGHCDLDGARRAYRRGCDLGDQVACERVAAPRVHCAYGWTDCTCLAATRGAS
jgi:TPR repeat protein